MLKAFRQDLQEICKTREAPELKAAFEEHAFMSAHQVERLEEVFATIEKRPRAKTCEAMSGIVAEMEEISKILVRQQLAMRS